MGNLLLNVEDAAGKEEEEGEERFGYKGNVVAIIQSFLCPSLKSDMIYRHVRMNGASGHACPFSS